MNFNLLNQLTKEDRVKIENYIRLYGVYKDFIGIDEWLKYWSINKIKMYKLLGNKLIYRVPFEYNKSQEELNEQISKLVFRNFPIKLQIWLDNHSDIFPSSIRAAIKNCCCRHILVADKIEYNIKFKLEGEKKTFQIQKGQKPIRVLGRFLTYCKNIDDIDAVMQAYEEFRLAHSMILNDRIVKGNIVVSIHPLDFMTMSDNNSNWQSCMSWKDNGCYHAGTVEMMNSNNVLCCYIENEAPYYFSDKSEEEYSWYNKKWRQLVYFTKDIIVSGKSYPYRNDEISKALIEIIRDLARKNLGWTYSFGPELYKDMIHITGSYSMRRAKNYIARGYMKKHNIIFDTKGMYNDMLNDHSTNYWCVRNKVNHNKVISYSGKAPCLCCGGPVVYDTEDNYDYNERYGNCGSVICTDCLDNFRCDFCNESYPNEKHYDIFLENGKQVKICERCIKDYIRKCPDCGKTMFVVPLYGYYSIISDEKLDYPTSFIKITEEDIDTEELFSSLWAYKPENLNSYFTTVFPICRCGKCAEKDPRFKIQTITTADRWSKRTRDFYISNEIEDKKKWEKYFPYNLEKTSVFDGEVITN